MEIKSLKSSKYTKNFGVKCLWKNQFEQHLLGGNCCCYHGACLVMPITKNRNLFVKSFHRVEKLNPQGHQIKLVERPRRLIKSGGSTEIWGESGSILNNGSMGTRRRRREHQQHTKSKTKAYAEAIAMAWWGWEGGGGNITRTLNWSWDKIGFVFIMYLMCLVEYIKDDKEYNTNYNYNTSKVKNNVWSSFQSKVFIGAGVWIVQSIKVKRQQ